MLKTIKVFTRTCLTQTIFKRSPAINTARGKDLTEWMFKNKSCKGKKRRNEYSIDFGQKRYMSTTKAIEGKIDNLVDNPLYWKEAIEFGINSGIYFPRGIEKILLKYKSGERERMEKCDFSVFPKLKEICIDKEIINADEVIFDNLKDLEKIIIEDNNFVFTKEKDSKGSLSINNCPNLKVIWIGDYCFNRFNELKISNVKSLKTIRFGCESFNSADGIFKGRRLVSIN